MHKFVTAGLVGAVGYLIYADRCNRECMHLAARTLHRHGEDIQSLAYVSAKRVMGESFRGS